MPRCCRACSNRRTFAAKSPPKARAATGLAEGTPVVAGAGDQAAGATGMGIVAPGSGERDDWNFRSRVCRDGSSCARSTRAASHVLPRRSRPLARHGRHPGRGTFAALVPRQFRGRRRKIRRHRSVRTLTAEAATAPAGSDGLLWTPYLMGERTPHLDRNARGALVGLTASHKRAHVVRAILEGVAFSLNDTFTIFGEMNVPVKSIRLGGGGARSPLWRQIQADVYGHEVEIVEAEEGAAYGAAILAGVGAKSGRRSMRHATRSCARCIVFSLRGKRARHANELCSLSSRVSSNKVDLQCVASSIGASCG